MKTTTITLRLEPELAREVDRIASASGRSRSDVVRDALRRQLAVLRFEALRRRAAPFAEARGWLADEDVFRDVS